MTKNRRSSCKKVRRENPMLLGYHPTSKTLELERPTPIRVKNGSRRSKMNAHADMRHSRIAPVKHVAQPTGVLTLQDRSVVVSASLPVREHTAETKEKNFISRLRCVEKEQKRHTPTKNTSRKHTLLCQANVGRVTRTGANTLDTLCLIKYIAPLFISDEHPLTAR